MLQVGRPIRPAWSTVSTASVRAVKARRRHVGTSAPPAWTALALNRVEVSDRSRGGRALTWDVDIVVDTPVDVPPRLSLAPTAVTTTVTQAERPTAIRRGPSVPPLGLGDGDRA